MTTIFSCGVGTGIYEYLSIFIYRCAILLTSHALLCSNVFFLCLLFFYNSCFSAVVLFFSVLCVCPCVSLFVVFNVCLFSFLRIGTVFPLHIYSPSLLMYFIFVPLHLPTFLHIIFFIITPSYFYN